MNADRVAIILEAVSFFLVTLDLFGKERLNDTYQSIITRLEKAKHTNFALTFSKFFRAKHFCLLWFILVFAIVFILKVEVILYKPKYNIVWNIVYGMFLVGIWAFIVLSPILFIGKLLDWFVHLTLGNLVKALYRNKVEGVMITIGTILFLVSKFISFRYS